MEQRDIDRLAAISKEQIKIRRVAKEADRVLEVEAESIRKRCDHTNPDGTQSFEEEFSEKTFPTAIIFCTLCGHVLTDPG